MDEKHRILEEIKGLHKMNQALVHEVGLSYKPGVKMSADQMPRRKLIEGPDGEPQFVLRYKRPTHYTAQPMRVQWNPQGLAVLVAAVDLRLPE